MRFLSATAALGIALACASPSEAQLFGMATASDITHNCRQVLNIVDRNSDDESAVLAGGMCIGYMVGFMQSYTSLGESAPEQFVFCKPEGVSTEQIIRVIVKYGDDHPELLHYHAWGFVAEALRSSFPC